MANFPSTQWSLVRCSGSPPSRRAAFGELALAYREAILAFFRSRLGPAAAEDAAQSFLASSFEHDWWSRADAEMGSFRGFLLLLLRRHLGHIRRADHSTELTGQLADAAPALEHQFDARFALILTARAVNVLRTSYRERGRERIFERLLGMLSSPPEHGELKTAAASLDIPANTLTIELQRLRKRLREEVRRQLEDLCAEKAAFDAEWTILQQVLGGAG